MNDAQTFADRFAAAWNEPDPAARGVAVRHLWAEDAVMETDGTRHRGHREIEARIAQEHAQSAQSGRAGFAALGDAELHSNAVTFTVRTALSAGGVPARTGTVVALLNDDGRVHTAYRFTVDSRTGTREAVEEFLRRSAEGVPDRIAALYAPQVDWKVSWPVADHPAVPWLVPRATRADVADHFVTFAATCVGAAGAITLDRILIDGCDAVLTGLSEQTVAATGRRFAMTFALHLTVEDGLIVRHHMYEDSLSVRAAFD